jgi:rhodanese-related sulfurtransferase
MLKQPMIDVREKDEFEAEHVDGSILIPLSEFGHKARPILSQFSGKAVTIMCRSGKRATLAMEQGNQFGIPGLKLEVFPGGILKWKEDGNPTVAKKKWHFPIMRQVQLVVGLAVVTGTALAYSGNKIGFLLTGFFGAGLTVAGLTGFCGLAFLLARMPWNQGSENEKQGSC